LMVHKSTHHFDLVNRWIDSFPEEVCAMGALRFYGKENAEKRGVSEFYYRGSAGGAADDDPFALDLKNDSTLKGLYYEAEKADGYHRDLSVFSSGISIEDDVGVLVRYRNRAVMTYHLNAYAPKEGYRVVFNGTKGRLELDVLERAYVSGAADDHNRARNVSGDSKSQVEEPTKLVFQPLWGEAEEIAIEALNTGGHGGGDRRMLDDIFRPSGEDPLGRAAGYRDGAYSILTGVAANRSMATGRTVKVSELLENEI